MSSSTKRATHTADGRHLTDDRGYSGNTIKGQNPALLFEKAVRDRITDSYYWKEQCFGLNCATLCDRAAELRFIGGTYGGMGKPTPFLCLAFKLLQLVPEDEIILEYLNFTGEEEDEDEDSKEEEEEREGQNGNRQENGMPSPAELKKRRKGSFKYLRALAAFYIRLAWHPVDIYKTLEPLLADYRKLKRRTKEGYALTYMDQFVDDLLTKDRVCATSLWKLQSREQLEDLDLLEPRVSALGSEVEDLDEEALREMGQIEGSRSDGEVEGGRGRSRSYDSRSGRESRSPRSRSRGSDYSYRRRDDYSRSRSPDRYRRRPSSPRSRSRDRYRRRSSSPRSRDRAYRRRDDSSRSRSRDSYDDLRRRRSRSRRSDD